MKYNVVARLTKPRLRILTSDNPGLEDRFNTYIFGLKDPFKSFMLNVFRNIDYLNDLKAHLFHKVIYSFKENNFEKGELLHKVGESVEVMVILISGEFEIFIELESMVFVVEKL